MPQRTPDSVRLDEVILFNNSSQSIGTDFNVVSYTLLNSSISFQTQIAIFHWPYQYTNVMNIKVQKAWPYRIRQEPLHRVKSNYIDQPLNTPNIDTSLTFVRHSWPLDQLSIDASILVLARYILYVVFSYSLESSNANVLKVPVLLVPAHLPAPTLLKASFLSTLHIANSYQLNPLVIHIERDVYAALKCGMIIRVHMLLWETYKRSSYF